MSVVFCRQFVISTDVSQHNDGMDSSHQSILDLAAQRGLIRPRDLNERGLPTVALTRLVRQGLLQRVGRGLYAIPDRPVSEHGALGEPERRHFLRNPTGHPSHPREQIVATSLPSAARAVLRPPQLRPSLRDALRQGSHNDLTPCRIP